MSAGLEMGMGTVSKKVPEGSLFAYPYMKAIIANGKVVRTEDKVVRTEDAVVRFIKVRGQMSDTEIGECKALAKKLADYHVALISGKLNLGYELTDFGTAREKFLDNHRDIAIENLNIK